MPDTKTLATNHFDFNRLDQKIALRSKSFQDGYLIPEHRHDSHQLLYATNGVMRLYTEREMWIVPNHRAVYIPAATSHSVKMYGEVTMRTLYIAYDDTLSHPPVLRVMFVTHLLRELIAALEEEPTSYSPLSRGDKIAQLIQHELDRAQSEAFNIPLPVDPRLQTLCALLLADPSDRKTLDEWSFQCGASVRTLSRLFESDLGMSFRRWRQLVRFHSAIQALSQGAPISHVAQRVGYQSPSAFTAAFHCFIGYPPSELVKQSPRQ